MRMRTRVRVRVRMIDREGVSEHAWLGKEHYVRLLGFDNYAGLAGLDNTALHYMAKEK